MKYIIKYFFDGYGVALTDAKDEEEAREKFFEGNAKYKGERGNNYNINTITEVRIKRTK